MTIIQNYQMEKSQQQDNQFVQRDQLELILIVLINLVIHELVDILALQESYHAHNDQLEHTIAVYPHLETYEL